MVEQLPPQKRSFPDIWKIMTWLKLGSKSFTRVLRTRTVRDGPQRTVQNILNPEIMMMGCGFLIDRNVVFGKIFQNICRSFCRWINAGSLPLNSKKSQYYFNDIPFVNYPSSASGHLNNWAFFFNDSFFRDSRPFSTLTWDCPWIPACADIYHSIFYIERTFLSTICSLDFLAQDNSGLPGLQDCRTVCLTGEFVNLVWVIYNE